MRPDFRVNDRLRLEIETPGDYTTGAQNNLVLNPDGAQGGYWWSSTASCHVVSTTAPRLALLMDTAGGGHINTGYMPVTPGLYVAAQFTILTIQASHNVQAVLTFENAARTIISATTASTYTVTGTQYLTPVVVPAGAVYCRIHLYYYAGASGTASAAAGDTFAFTNVALTTGTTNTFATVRTNLVTNPSFETNTTGWAFDYVGGTVPTAARVTSGGFSGPCFYRVTSTDATTTSLVASTNPRVSVVKGQTYTVSAYVKAPAGKRVDMALSWHLSANTPFTTSGGSLPLPPAATGSWQRISLTMTAADNYLSVKLSATASAVGHTLDVDAVLIEKAGTLGAYFDGSTTSGSGHTYGWTGTAHASTSTDTLSAWAYLPPFQYQNVLGSANAIKVSREALNVGTLAATIVDSALDPATAPDVIAVGRRCRLMALASTGSWAPLFTGYVDNASTTYVMDKNTGVTKPQITLTAHDGTQDLANILQPSGVGALANLPGLFEGAAGYTIPVPWNVNGNRDPINTFTTVSNNPDASLLDQVAIVRDIAHGKAWVGADGVLNVFPPSTPAAVVTYQDTAANSATLDSYSDIDVTFSTSSVINSISVKSLKVIVTGETWTYDLGPFVDQNSIDKYGAYSATFTLQGMSDAAVATWAGEVLAANAVPIRKVNSVTVPVTDSYGIDHALAVDLCSPVAVVRSGGLVNGTFRVESISHTIQADADFDRWQIQYQFADPSTVASPQQIPTTAVAVASTSLWSTYAATVSGMTNCTATTARYVQDGGRVRVQLVVTFTGATTSSGNGLQFTLPVNADTLAAHEQIGVCTIIDASPVARYAGAVIAQGGSPCTAGIVRALGTSGLHIGTSATAPITWAAGDVVLIDLEYLAAA